MSGKNYLLFCVVVFFSLGQIASANTITGQDQGKKIYTARAEGNSKSIVIEPVEATVEEGEGVEEGVEEGKKGRGRSLCRRLFNRASSCRYTTAALPFTADWSG